MTSPASDLPNEVLTQILVHLSLSELYKCHLVCKQWREVASGDAVLRELCWRLGYLPRGTLLSDLTTPRRAPPADDSLISDGHRHSAFRLDGRQEVDAASLQDLVKRSRLLRKIKFPPPPKSVDLEEAPPEVQGVVKAYANSDDEYRSDIWRFKIDRTENVMITTGARGGGVAVLDLDTGQELWRNPDVRGHAHLEHDEGWVVHDIRKRDEEDHFQVYKFERLVKHHPSPRRGVLVPVATIRCSTQPNAFRLKWPHLAVATRSEVVVYDVTTCEVAERFQHHRIKSSRWSIKYIEMDDDFIFLLTSPPREPYRDPEGGLWVGERCKQGRTVLDTSRQELFCEASYTIQGRLLTELTYGDQAMMDCPTLGLPLRVTRDPGPFDAYTESTQWADAVHPDERTGSLVLSGGGLIMVIPNYKKEFKKPSGVKAWEMREIPAIGVMSDTDFEDYNGTEPEKAFERMDGSRGRPSSYLAVADGIAAFVPKWTASPTWLDLRTLLRAARNPAVTPRAATMCLGQSLIDHCAGFVFLKTSCLQLDSSGIHAVAELHLEKRFLGHPDIIRSDGVAAEIAAFAAATTTTLEPYTMVLSMSFDKILRAKVAHPDLDVDKWPRKTDIEFPRRSADTESQRAAWLAQRDELQGSKVVAPDAAVFRWSDWKKLRDVRRADSSQLFAPNELHWLVGHERWRHHERAAAEGGGQGQGSLPLVEAVDDELDGGEWSNPDDSEGYGDVDHAEEM